MLAFPALGMLSLGPQRAHGNHQNKDKKDRSGDKAGYGPVPVQNGSQDGDHTPNQRYVHRSKRDPEVRGPDVFVKPRRRQAKRQRKQR